MISLSGHLGVLVFLLVVWVFLVALSLPKFDSLSGGPCKALCPLGIAYCSNDCGGLVHPIFSNKEQKDHHTLDHSHCE